MVTVLPDGGRPQSQRTDAEQVPFPHKLITAPGCGGGIIVLRKTPPGGSQAGFRDISTPRSHAPSNVRLHRDFCTSAQPEGHRQGWYYLSTVLDDFSRYIVAFRLVTQSGRTRLGQPRDTRRKLTLRQRSTWDPCGGEVFTIGGAFTLQRMPRAIAEKCATSLPKCSLLYRH